MDNYRSDAWILELFEGWFDPCPLDPNPKIDGLNLPWDKNTFINPPYSDPKPWVAKAIRDHKLYRSTIALLLKADNSTAWFGMLHQSGAHFLWIGERLKYGTGTAAAFPSMIAILHTTEKLKNCPPLTSYGLGE